MKSFTDALFKYLLKDINCFTTSDGTIYAWTEDRYCKIVEVSETEYNAQYNTVE